MIGEANRTQEGNQATQTGNSRLGNQKISFTTMANLAIANLVPPNKMNKTKVVDFRPHNKDPHSIRLNTPCGIELAQPTALVVTSAGKKGVQGTPSSNGKQMEGGESQKRGNTS